MTISDKIRTEPFDGSQHESALDPRRSTSIQNVRSGRRRTRLTLGYCLPERALSEFAQQEAR